MRVGEITYFSSPLHVLVVKMKEKKLSAGIYFILLDAGQ
jgi:hypothetical protein